MGGLETDGEEKMRTSTPTYIIHSDTSALLEID